MQGYKPLSPFYRQVKFFLLPSLTKSQATHKAKKSVGYHLCLKSKIKSPRVIDHFLFTINKSSQLMPRLK